MVERQEEKPENRVSKALGGTADRLNSGAKYQGALEAVFAIPVGAGLGYFADKYFESNPVGLLIGFALGFAAFILGLVRLRPDHGETSESTKIDQKK